MTSPCCTSTSESSPPADLSTIQKLSPSVRTTLGVVMANGFPIAHHVFPGNTAEKATMQEVLTDLQNRFGLRRVMVVSDRGLVSPDNLDFLSKTRLCYLLGIPGRRCEESAEILEALDTNRWQRVDQTNRVQEVRLGGRSCRYFVIDSEERKVYEESMRLRSMERAKEQLQKRFKQSVQKPN